MKSANNNSFRKNEEERSDFAQWTVFFFEVGTTEAMYMPVFLYLLDKG